MEPNIVLEEEEEGKRERINGGSRGGEGERRRKADRGKEEGLNVNSVHQLGWTIVPRYLVKHQFECCLETGFQMRLTLKSVEFEYRRLLSISGPYPIS